MIDLSDVTEIIYDGQDVTQIEDSLGNVLWSATPVPPVPVIRAFYVEDATGSGNTVSISKSNAGAPTIEVFKSLDMVNWDSMGTTSTTDITAAVPPNGRLYLKAVADKWADITEDWVYNRIRCASSFKVGGYLMSLLAGDNFEGATLQYNWAFPFLLSNNTNLVDASSLILPSNTTGNCYSHFFSGCTALVGTPSLVATNVAGSAYEQMFYGCTSMTQLPAMVDATLGGWCFFESFAGCTGLTSVVLPQTTYTRENFVRAFDGCTNLSSITTYVTNLDSWACPEWVSNVAATGDFYNLGGVTFDSGSNGIPTGWTEHTSL